MLENVIGNVLPDFGGTSSVLCVAAVVAHSDASSSTKDQDENLDDECNDADRNCKHSKKGDEYDNNRAKCEAVHLLLQLDEPEIQRRALQAYLEARPLVLEPVMLEA
jgi:hypothetical protein